VVGKGQESGETSLDRAYNSDMCDLHLTIPAKTESPPNGDYGFRNQLITESYGVSSYILMLCFKD
jgi:hypothetical protein